MRRKAGLEFHLLGVILPEGVHVVEGAGGASILKEPLDVLVRA